MSTRALRPRSNICQLCESMLRRGSLRGQIILIRSVVKASNSFSTQRRSYAQKSQISSPAQAAEPQDNSFNGQLEDVYPPSKSINQVTEAQLEEFLVEVKASSKTLRSHTKVRTNDEVLSVLAKCKFLANMLADDWKGPKKESKDKTATSTLLSLEDSDNKRILSKKPSPAVQLMARELSDIAYTIVKHPTIFISAEALGSYISIQAALQKPGTLAEVFELYAKKPVPEEGSSPVRYLDPKPNRIASAIPPELADKALGVAIKAKEMIMAMDIIEASYTTTAFKRTKFLRKAALPAAGLAIAPVAAYQVASQFAALFQNTLEKGTATGLAFAGIIAYVGFTATTGFVAMSTANDQMERVTWAPGIPLRERWMREEERAAIDKIAQAWGFRETWRRGDEEGEEWDALREWIGHRKMLLDRPELMEGME